MQYCSIDGHTPARNPQGSSPGQILFPVYVNDLSNACEHSQTNLFADNTNIPSTCTAKMTSEAQGKISGGS